MLMRTGGAGLLIPGVEVIQAGGGDTPWWLAAGVTPVAAYAPKGAADLSSSYVNVANPSINDAAPGVAPTFNTSTGWTFNGTTQYLTTGVVPLARTWSYIVRFSGVSNTGVLYGVQKAGEPSVSMLPNFSDNKVYYENANFLGVTPGITSGVLAVANLACYRNGVSDGSMSVLGTFPSTVAFYIGGRNNNGSLANACACVIQALAFYNVTLDATQIATTTTAMQAL